MEFKQLNRSDAEKIFGVYRNITGSTISTGTTVELEVDAVTDGNSVTACKSGALASLFVGVTDAAMADDAYGLIQVYGYKSEAYVSAASAGTAVGTWLKPVSGILVDETMSAAGVSGFHHVTLLETVAASAGSSSAALRPIFIRAL